MFDLVTGKARHAPRHQAVPMLVSIAAHAVIGSALIAATVLIVTNPAPVTPTMMAFVAAPPAPPPPPPPPTPPAKAARQSASRPLTRSAAEVPVEPPMEPPAEFAAETLPVSIGDDEGSGIEWGVPGGMVGGVMGGLESVIPPPPPAAPVTGGGPVRVGGQIREPTLIYRVEPVYPGAAISANIEGTVILEAIVDEEGRVETVRVLRPLGVLDRAALAAVKQWRYSPVILNGRPERFILTVAVTFRLEGVKR